MQILQSSDFGALIEKRANAAGGSVSRRKRRDARNVIANRRAANGFLVVKRFAAERRVDDQIDLAGLDEVNDVGAAFIHLEDGLGWNPGRFERSGRAARRKQRETKIVQLL